DGGWRIEDGGKAEDGGWRMEDGGWRMEDRGWRMEIRVHLCILAPRAARSCLIQPGLHPSWAAGSAGILPAGRGPARCRRSQLATPNYYGPDILVRKFWRGVSPQSPPCLSPAW